MHYIVFVIALECFRNCKYYDVYQGHFRKQLQNYEKTKIWPMKFLIFSKGRSVSAIFDA